MNDDRHADPDVVLEWLDYAARDLHGARTLLVGGDFAWVLVLCQQAVEKALKATIVSQSGEMPPHTHKLLRLIELTGIDVPQEMAEFISDLDLSYIESRYPGGGIEPTEGLDEHTVAEFVAETEEIVRWLSSRLS